MFNNPSRTASSRHSALHIHVEPPQYALPLPNIVIPSPALAPARPVSYIHSNSHHNSIHSPLVDPYHLSATSHSISPSNDPLPVQHHHIHSRKPPSLPSTKDLPKLMGKRDWGAWNTAITNLILNQHVYNHISDGLKPGACYILALIPMYEPPIHLGSTQAELEENDLWWSMDGIVSHILTSAIDTSILNSLPILNIELGEQRTAHDIYGFLCLHYGSGDYNSIINIETRLRRLFCSSGPGSISIQEYITTY
jgi:hypothetical protein